MQHIKKMFFIFLLAYSYVEAGVCYTVKYLGIDDSAVLKTLRSTTELSTLIKRHPDSFNAVRYRAETDIPTILHVMHSYGYYEAQVHVQIEEGFEQAVVLVHIHPGPNYIIDSFDIKLYEQNPSQVVICPFITLERIGIKLGTPMNAKAEIQAELIILQLLSECGYPLASIENKDITADGDTHSINIQLGIKTGPLCRYAQVDVTGSKSVKPDFFTHKLEWKQGDLYTKTAVEKTQKALIDSGLFSTVIITHPDELNENNALPIVIEVAESKHRSINAGISYQTYYGPGLTFGWENRNIAGMGQRLSIQGDMTKRSHTGVATYLHPNFGRVDQDYVWQGQAMHENITPYSERTYNLTSRIERRIGEKIRMSVGGTFERLFITSSAQNGQYWLVEAPIYFAWNGSNSLLNPTQGLFFEYTASPCFVIDHEKDLYFSNLFSFSYYLPVTKTYSFSIAQKITAGSIFSKNKHIIPLSKRLFGGSEEDLRGYAYQSVSPLASPHKPEGGRSAIFYTLETRFRMSQSIGMVPFFDIGRVYSSILPSFKGKWLKSVGLGLRYFSFMGPFRIDVGFPLNKREYLDNNYRILVSIGQTF
ncbi:MAG: BamA/TamA family outer membrane protein [Chlamydiia bacterium]